MPLQATSGAASYDAFGGGVPVVPVYIEDVMSTWLYTGNGSTQTITNGIDLSTKGGLVWLKMRNFNQGHILFDTIRGIENYLQSASSDEQYNLANSLTAFNTTGFSVGSGASTNAEPYVSWSFEKQSKFFDMVSWTGSGSNRTIAHSLGSVPGCIMVKRTDVAANWQVYHRSLANTEYLVLNSTAAKATGATRWNSTTPTSTVFSIGTDDTVNASGGTYVAYVFAHDAGGFGLTGTDNVISCGSYTGDGTTNSSKVISLGWEAQYVLIKKSSGTGGWWCVDTMRGFINSGDDAYGGDATLFANSSGAESNNVIGGPNATGFYVVNDNTNLSGATYIYIAIRRGPMKVPTVGTSVFSPQSTTVNTSSNTIVSSGTAGPIDLVINQQTSASGGGGITQSRLTGGNYLITSSTGAESSGSYTNWDRMTGTKPTPWTDGQQVAVFAFKRAPSFFDEVCYTVSGYAANNVAHNLTVTPELFITKPRGSNGGWTVYGSILGATTKYMTLNDTQAVQTSGGTVWGATSSTFSEPSTIQNGTYVCYLFATCAGVSKIGSYTGTATTLQIDCGFTAGARFVLIKRTDSTGDWYVWDTARGIVSGNDSYLLLNSTAAEVTNTDYIDTYSAGFEISSTAPAAINASGGSFIFFAVA